MDVKNAMIIKTQDYSQSGQARKVRDLLNCFDEGQNIVIVPHCVTDLLITFDETENELLVKLYQTDNDDTDPFNPYNPFLLDTAKGFDCVKECWEYARIVMKEAGLPEDSCDCEVWEETSFFLGRGE